MATTMHEHVIAMYPLAEQAIRRLADYLLVLDRDGGHPSLDRNEREKLLEQIYALLEVFVWSFRGSDADGMPLDPLSPWHRDQP